MERILGNIKTYNGHKPSDPGQAEPFLAKLEKAVEHAKNLKAKLS